MIPVKCNVHSWMHAYIGVMPHPYFAVTGAGWTFELTNLPPGDYTIAVWHEKLGNQEKQVHLDPPRHRAWTSLIDKTATMQKPIDVQHVLVLAALLSRRAPAGSSYRVYVSNEGSGDLTVIDPVKMEAPRPCRWESARAGSIPARTAS